HPQGRGDRTPPHAHHARPAVARALADRRRGRSPAARSQPAVRDLRRHPARARLDRRARRDRDRLRGHLTTAPQAAGATNVQGGGLARAGSSAFRMYWPVIGLEMIDRWSLKSSLQWSCSVMFVTFGPDRKLLVYGLTSSS